MKIVKELPEIFDEFGEQRRKAFLEIKQYKEKGMPVVGMYCAYFPPELAIAAGAVPVALCSFSQETIPVAEHRMPKSMCPLVKSSYGFSVEDKCPLFHFTDLIIGETTCDGKKKMYEMMSEFKPVHIMELPNCPSERGYEFWRQEIVRMKEKLEDFFQVVITEEKLRQAVHLNNRIRMSLKNLCDVMKLDPAPVTGEDIQKMVLGSKYRFDFENTPEIVEQVRKQILDEYQKGKKLGERVRILVTGCPIGGDTLKVIRAIENNGGVVVATENCSGVRSLATMVEEDTEDIYGAIAKKYLSTGCSIMTPNDNRIDLLGEIIDEYHVDGVVEVILSGCHSTGAESYYIKKFVNEEKHLPYISIDTDYSTADMGQIVTRLTAFIEMIQTEKSDNTNQNVDIDYCYKIVRSEVNAGSDDQHIFQKIWDYVGIPVCIYDEKGKLSAGAQEVRMEVCKDKIERLRVDGSGKLVAGIPENIPRTNVEKILNILLKGQDMRRQLQRCGEKKNPDYLWLLSEDKELLKNICRHIREEATLAELDYDCEGERVFVYGLQGRDQRCKLIELCHTCVQRIDSRVLVGNGFQEMSFKEDNYKMQSQILQIAAHTKEKVILIENYYYELAMKCIAEESEGRVEYEKELDALKVGGKDLQDTLYWYLRMKRNISCTAAKLKIHRNTLIPRLEKINDILELDNLDGKECEKLLVSLEIERMKNNKSSEKQ